MEASILYVEKIYIHSLVFIVCEDKKSIPHPYIKQKRAHRRPESRGWRWGVIGMVHCPHNLFFFYVGYE